MTHNRSLLKLAEAQVVLKSFYILTTAPDDAKLQEHARKLTARHQRKGLFDVNAMGWSKIVRRAAQRARHQVKQEIDGWLDVAGIEKGPIFRRVLASGRVGKNALTERAVWQQVREYAAQIGIGELAAHDLRRYADRRAGNWNKFSFCWGMSRS